MAGYGAREVGGRISGLRAQLQEILQARRAAEEAFRTGEYQEENSFRDRRNALERSLRDALQAEEKDFAARRSAIAARAERRSKAAARALASMEGRLRQGLQQDLKVLNERLQQAKERANQEPSKHDNSDVKAEIEPLRRSAQELASELGRFAANHGVRIPEAKSGGPGASGPETGTEQPVDRIAEGIRRIRRSALELSQAFWPELAKTVSAGVIVGLILLAHGGAAAAIVKLDMDRTRLAWAGGSLLVTLAAALLLAFAARRRVASAVNRLHTDLRWSLDQLDLAENRSKVEERIARIMVIDEQVAGQAAQRRQECDDAVAGLRTRHDRLAARITRERDGRMGELEAAHAATVARIREANAADASRTQAEHVAARQSLRDEQEAAISALSARWREQLDSFAGFARRAPADCRGRHPAWSDPHWRTPALPRSFPSEAPLGSVLVDVAALADDPERHPRFPPPGEARAVLPLALGFPDCGSLLVQASGAARPRALEAVFNAAMRILASFPPGKARLTIVDPIGLGQSFAALMHLADHDESLVGARIWTDPAHIERRMGELTEHIEKVIQKYLRNRYATIDEYNREAGEMTEPYQFLVVADFPTGFNDLALERLASIVNSGPRCGVFTLIFHDSAQQLPAVLDQARLRSSGPALVAAEPGEAKFLVDGEDFRGGAFTPDSPPDGALVARLLKTIGEGARESQRVEVPFTAVTPPDGKLWSASTDAGFRVPIGRSGADRLQHLDLGRGTAQHALIGGRTGSGKSTLFHVIATNAAMWFSPAEVEFYLIDFKHGVEFKTYATAGLPHARVVAIESDREFGLSVLAHINRELNRRGDLFRKHGVQDLPAYRKSGAAEHLPRVLLIIDEFQEFFTEDDVIARDAALLLDRFVRQGRAFGVHAILGSQTLSGMYTLAKSTLGQMGVRIALQCNEADSHMILSEDNGAARLLTRPGDAIYNDMSGLVEGNSPFQVVWLPDDIHEATLRGVVERARQAGYRPPEPMVVFEGNVPADLGRNQPLRELLDSPVPAATDSGPGCGRVWLGEANAIKGPTEIDLIPASGANLLMIGQHREAALAMICSAAVSLAAANRPARIRLIAVGADGRDAEGTEALDRLAKVLPGGIELPAAREIPKIVAELEAGVAAAKESGKPPEQLVCLMVFGLQRFAALRHEDDFGIGGGEEGASTGERFANVIRDGPEQGVHVLVWCDTLNNINRAISRKTLREFDLRVLFQMSAADSSELIDSAAAGNLGLHNAILASMSGGTQEKFRPYTIPEPGYMEEIGRAMAKKFGGKG